MVLTLCFLSCLIKAFVQTHPYCQGKWKKCSFCNWLNKNKTGIQPEQCETILDLVWLATVPLCTAAARHPHPNADKMNIYDITQVCFVIRLQWARDSFGRCFVSLWRVETQNGMEAEADPLCILVAPPVFPLVLLYFFTAEISWNAKLLLIKPLINWGNCSVLLSLTMCIRKLCFLCSFSVYLS